MNIAFPKKGATHPFLPSDLKPKKMLIGGRWVDSLSGESFDSVNPANGQLLARVAKAGQADVDAAVEAARHALEGEWAKFKPFDRQALLLKLADLVEENFSELAWLDTLDFGGPISRTMNTKRRLVGLLRYYAGLAISIHGETIENSMPGDIFSYTLKEPVGVVGIIIPWNAPTAIAIWQLAPALASGCTVVLKPAQETALSALRLGELILEAGFPAGAVNIVCGGGDVGAAMAEHRGIDKISFTGSTVTGQSIIRASAGNFKRLSLELGGKSPNIVLADADLDFAVPGSAMGIFGNSGQTCSAGSRLFVAREIYDEFISRVAEFGAKMKLGDPLDSETQIGPVVSERQKKRVADYIDLGQAEGADLIVGGAAEEQELAAGYFIKPTIFGNVDDKMRIAREEIFGPVAVAIPFDDLDDVIRRSNDTDFGLAGGIWTNDLARAQRFIKSVRAGCLWVNCYQAMDPAVPFGGYKMSGYGRASGLQHMQEYMTVKSVMVRAG
jgi:aldehyde dehydrogenase (NAD+)